jgi:hypothetical protein
MLTIFRRHVKACPQHPRRYGKVSGTRAKPMLIDDAIEIDVTDVQSDARASRVRLHRCFRHLDRLLRRKAAATCRSLI